MEDLENNRKRNLKWLGLLLLLLSVIVMNAFLLGAEDDNEGIDRAMFAVQDTETIGKLEVNGGSLEYTGGKWLLNEKFQANPDRIYVLFAALKQISVRRELSGAILEDVAAQMDSAATVLSLYREGEKFRDLELFGNPSNSLTYVRNSDGIYLVEIPGYRAWVYGLLVFDELTWRHPNILIDFPWRNLKSVEVTLPTEVGEAGFSIVQGREFFEVAGMEETDTTKLTNYIDHLSLLMAEEFVSELQNVQETPLAEFNLYDVGNNQHRLVLYKSADPGREIFGVYDDKSFFYLSMEKTVPLLREKSYFYYKFTP